MARRPLIRAGLLLATLAFAAACDSVYHARDQVAGFFGLGPNNPPTLQLLGFSIVSDHPISATSAGGAAQGVVGSAVTFTALGTFQDVNSLALSTGQITGTVVWASTVPGIGFPGADGKVLLAATGTTVISASSPSVGSIPAFHSNAIPLQSLP